MGVEASPYTAEARSEAGKRSLYTKCVRMGNCPDSFATRPRRHMRLQAYRISIGLPAVVRISYAENPTNR